MSCVDFQAKDTMFGVLPPFHSFGFSVTGILPLLAGFKVFYAPDPTDSRGMANDIFDWKPTLLCCAPSFIKALFQIASPKELQSIWLFVSRPRRPQGNYLIMLKGLDLNMSSLRDTASQNAARSSQ